MEYLQVDIPYITLLNKQMGRLLKYYLITGLMSIHLIAMAKLPLYEHMKNGTFRCPSYY